ncbi:MAG: type II secretion system protein GspC [Pseudomonadota bacterium]|nr:MAG: type II secretion system protein GspC [Pseudomonadota bacterium]
MQNIATMSKADWQGQLAKLPLKQWLNQAPRWVTWLLVLLIAKLLADLTWVMLTPDPTTAARPVQRRAAAPQAAPEARLKDVATLHLLGEAKVAPVAGGDQPIDAPKTRLNLKLRGVMATGDPATAMAIIGDGKGKEMPYRQGDAVPGNAKLHEIYVDRVILDRAGRLETLPLPRERLEKTSVRAGNKGTSRRSLPQPRPQAATSAGATLKGMRDSLTSDPQKFWSQVRIEPQYKDGNISGYTFRHKDHQVMRSLGIRPSDVIVAVNGLPVSDPSSLAQLQGMLSSAQSVSLSIERNGRQQTLDIDMQ